VRALLQDPDIGRFTTFKFQKMDPNYDECL